MSTTTITNQMLKLSEIIPDPNQPRKFFDQQALDELTVSVKSMGVFQNILVRPCSPKVQNHRKAIYMIVVGERRYKASVAAGVKEIPCTIRELTDEQALEIQITENLMRKDVQAMEEATAFKSLFNHNHFAVEEIAARVGKSASYVAGRIKLCDLLPDFQEILFHNKMYLSDAIKLSRFDVTMQKQLLEEKCKNWKKNYKDWHIGNISWYLNNSQHDLNKATFKISDASLYPEAGTCTVCPHNSACNPTLFEELNKQKICHSPVCFGIKTDRGYQRKLEELRQKPEVLFIANSSYLSDQDKQKVSVAEEMGITVLKERDFEEAETEEAPKPWEEYWEEQKDFRAEDDDTGEELAELMQEVKSEWEEMEQDYQLSVKQLEAARAEGKVVNAFVVAGNGVGKMTEIILKKSVGVGLASTQTATLELQQEIEALEAKEKRNQELDREKIFKASMQALELCDYLEMKQDLLPVEEKAILVMVAEHCHQARTLISNIVGKSDLFDIANYLETADTTEVNTIANQAMRIAIYNKLVSDVYSDFGKFGSAAAMQAVALATIPAQVKDIIRDQAQKSIKRSGTIEMQIDVAKRKIEAIINPPVPQPLKGAALAPGQEPPATQNKKSKKAMVHI